MEDFLRTLPETERKELLDYLHQRRYDCHQSQQVSLFRNLSQLLRVLELSPMRKNDR